MSDTFVFSPRYEPAVLRRAVTAFVGRSLFQEQALRSVVPVALLALGCVMIARGGDPELGLGLFLFSVTALFLLIAAGWRMHWRRLSALMAKMANGRSVVRLSDSGFVIDAGAGAAERLDWQAVRAIWRFDDVWLLIVASNHFVPLPLAGAPKEALAFLEAQVARTGVVS